MSSFFPPRKSNPSSIALHMNGLAPPRSSLASDAASHRAFDMACGEDDRAACDKGVSSPLAGV